MKRRERDDLLAACAVGHRELQVAALAATEQSTAGLVRGAAAQLLQYAFSGIGPTGNSRLLSVC